MSGRGTLGFSDQKDGSRDGLVFAVKTNTSTFHTFNDCMFSIKQPTMVPAHYPSILSPFILYPSLSSMQYLQRRASLQTHSGGDGEGGGATFTPQGGEEDQGWAWVDEGEEDSNNVKVNLENDNENTEGMEE